MPAPDGGEIPPPFPEKPASGPVIMLTAEPMASEALPSGAAAGVIPAPAYPKPGRGDDFSWPK
jgi:hypothetical protein